MSQYPWPLLAVYVVTIGVVQLLALWAATSTRPWLLRAILVWAAILLLIPIRVYEPALLLTMSTMLTVVFTSVVSRFTLAPNATSRLRWRFGLADLLVVILFIATLLAIATQFIPRQRALSTWQWSGLFATAIAAITCLAHRAAIGGKRVVTLLLLLAVIWIFAILMRVYRFPLYLSGGPTDLGDPLIQNEIHSLVVHGSMVITLAICLVSIIWACKVRRGASVSMSRRVTSVVVAGVGLALLLPLNWLAWDFASRTTLVLRLSEIAFHTIPPFTFAGVIALASVFGRLGSSDTAGWKRLAVRSVASALGAIVAVPMAWLYWQMLWYTPYPALDEVPENHFDRIVEIGDRVQGFRTGITPLSKNLQAELDEAVILLQAPNYVPAHALEAETQTFSFREEPIQHNYFSLFQRLAEAAVNAQRARRPDQAADYAMAIVRYGTMFERGGTTQHMQGIGATEFFGYNVLSVHRHELSSAKARETIHLLHKSLLERDTDELILTRDKAYSERSGGWQGKLQSILARPTNDRGERSSYIMTIYYDERKRREAINLLLQADLAIRLFESDRGRLPHTLQDLSPDFLPELPIDPYSGRALIYRPGENGFVLYSVGRDGVDDGGKACHFAPPLDAKGFDLGLR